MKFGFESQCVYQFLASYTVGIAGLAVNQLSSDSGGLTPSLVTNLCGCGEMEDTHGLGPCAARRGGSTPLIRTNLNTYLLCTVLVHGVTEMLSQTPQQTLLWVYGVMNSMNGSNPFGVGLNPTGPANLIVDIYKFIWYSTLIIEYAIVLESGIHHGLKHRGPRD